MRYPSGTFPSLQQMAARAFDGTSDGDELAAYPFVARMAVCAERGRDSLSGMHLRAVMDGTLPQREPLWLAAHSTCPRWTDSAIVRITDHVRCHGNAAPLGNFMRVYAGYMLRELHCDGLSSASDVRAVCAKLVEGTLMRMLKASELYSADAFARVTAFTGMAWHRRVYDEPPFAGGIIRTTIIPCIREVLECCTTRTGIESVLFHPVVWMRHGDFRWGSDVVLRNIRAAGMATSVCSSTEALVLSLHGMAIHAAKGDCRHAYRLPVGAEGAMHVFVRLACRLGVLSEVPHRGEMDDVDAFVAELAGGLPYAHALLAYCMSCLRVVKRETIVRLVAACVVQRTPSNMCFWWAANNEVYNMLCSMYHDEHRWNNIVSQYLGFDVATTTSSPVPICEFPGQPTQVGASPVRSPASTSRYYGSGSTYWRAL